MNINDNENKDDNINEALKEKEIGNKHFKKQDYLNALMHYSKSIELHEISNTLNNRALVYIKLEQYSNAITDCYQILTLNIDDDMKLKALYRRAMAYEQKKEYKLALNDLKECLLINSKKIEIKNAYDRLQNFINFEEKKKENHDVNYNKMYYNVPNFRSADTDGKELYSFTHDIAISDLVINRFERKTVKDILNDAKKKFHMGRLQEMHKILTFNEAKSKKDGYVNLFYGGCNGIHYFLNTLVSFYEEHHNKEDWSDIKLRVVFNDIKDEVIARVVLYLEIIDLILEESFKFGKITLDMLLDNSDVSFYGDLLYHTLLSAFLRKDERNKLDEIMKNYIKSVEHIQDESHWQTRVSNMYKKWLKYDVSADDMVENLGITDSSQSVFEAELLVQNVPTKSEMLKREKMHMAEQICKLPIELLREETKKLPYYDENSSDEEVRSLWKQLASRYQETLSAPSFGVEDHAFYNEHKILIGSVHDKLKHHVNDPYKNKVGNFTMTGAHRSNMRNDNSYLEKIIPMVKDNPQPRKSSDSMFGVSKFYDRLRFAENDYSESKLNKIKKVEDKLYPTEHYRAFRHFAVLLSTSLYAYKKLKEFNNIDIIIDIGDVFNCAINMKKKDIEFLRMHINNIGDYTGMLFPFITFRGILQENHGEIHHNQMFNLPRFNCIGHYFYHSTRIPLPDEADAHFGLQLVCGNNTNGYIWEKVKPKKLLKKSELFDWLNSILIELICAPGAESNNMFYLSVCTTMKQFVMLLEFLNVEMNYDRSWIYEYLTILFNGVIRTRAKFKNDSSTHYPPKSTKGSIKHLQRKTRKEFPMSSNKITNINIKPFLVELQTQLKLARLCEQFTIPYPPLSLIEDSDIEEYTFTVDFTIPNMRRHNFYALSIGLILLKDDISNTDLMVSALISTFPSKCHVFSNVKYNINMFTSNTVTVIFPNKVFKDKLQKNFKAYLYRVDNDSMISSPININ